jgi:pyruvate-formate lyase-activating enzyme/diadenosine tetraphosphatase ApaH/serine/threonine PP2A family protein phosphatase
VTPIAAFGGAYGNPYALRAVLEDARRRGAGRVLNLGDLGGFGAEVDALWPLLEEHGVASLAGNYDVAIGRGDPDCGCGYTDPRDNEFAQVMYDHTRRTTSREFAAWMRELPGELRLEADGLDVLAVHGSPLDVADFLWESLPDDELALRVRAGGSPDVLLCTHTGLPWQREVDGTLVVNVGAAGRPANDGTRDVWYALLETDGGVARAELVRVAYDWRAQAASMRAAGLPEAFVETVETGWWTTCLEVVPPLERSRGAFHVYRDALPAPATGSDAGWADPVEAPAGDRPVVPLFGTALFPPRLWVYTNFDCNLACGYCVVESSPRARARRVDPGAFRELCAEAADEGFTELYLTGGEPFVHPDLLELVETACAAVPRVVLLTNAMLFAAPGRRRDALAAMAELPGFELQSSLDSAVAGPHDLQRGVGSWARALEGLHVAAGLGVPVRVAMTETPATAGQGTAVQELLDGVAQVAVRPLVARGFSEAGVAVSDEVMVPELTWTTDGLHWHPVGADRDASPDFVVAPAGTPLAEGKRRVVQRFLELRRADGTLPEAFACAV